MVVQGDSVRHRDRRSELRVFSTCHARTLDGAKPFASMLRASVENGRAHYGSRDCWSSPHIDTAP